MEQAKQLFDSAPLPYKYVSIPNLEDPPVQREKKLKTYVNKIITQLSTDAFQHSGFEITEDKQHWNASWGRQFIMIQYSSCKSWQKVNHFAGALLMGRKDHFHSRMTELRERVGDFATFYPESYLLPQEKDKLLENWKNHKLWISKPVASSQGRGICVLNSETSEVPDDQAIVQLYVDRPLLITGRKFDIRLYALVTSVSPMRIYMHDSGLIRFATHAYDPNADPSDVKVHLTNFSLNKDDEQFIRCNEEGEETINDSKWSIPFFVKYLQENGIDHKKLFEEFERVTVATLIAGLSTVRNHHARYVQHRHTSYEQFGIDILVDENFNASVMEVNISPAMSGMDSKLDYQIKGRLMHDLLRMARIIDCDCDLPQPCPGIDSVDHECEISITKPRLRAVEGQRMKAWDNPVFADYMMVRDFIEEKQLLGGYRRVFPKRKTCDTFIPCFDRMKYHDLVFIDWIKMTNEERIHALQIHWGEYSSKLAQFCQEDSTPDDEL